MDDFIIDNYCYQEYHFLNLFNNQICYMIIINWRINSKNLTIDNFNGRGTIVNNSRRIIELVNGSNSFINI